MLYVKMSISEKWGSVHQKNPLNQLNPLSCFSVQRKLCSPTTCYFMYIYWRKQPCWFSTNVIKEKCEYLTYSASFVCPGHVSTDNEWGASWAAGWEKRLGPPRGPPHSWHVCSPQLSLAAGWGGGLAQHQGLQSAVECALTEDTPEHCGPRLLAQDWRLERLLKHCWSSLLLTMLHYTYSTCSCHTSSQLIRLHCNVTLSCVAVGELDGTLFFT